MHDRPPLKKASWLLCEHSPPGTAFLSSKPINAPAWTALSLYCARASAMGVVGISRAIGVNLGAEV
jgi:hypothetical protein